MIRGKSTLAYKKEKKIQIIISQVEQGYTIISIQLYLSILHLHPSMQLIHNQPIYLYMYIYMHFFSIFFFNRDACQARSRRIGFGTKTRQNQVLDFHPIQRNGSNYGFTDRVLYKSKAISDIVSN